MWKQTQINPKYEVSDDGQVRTIATGHIKSQKTDEAYRDMGIYV